MTTTNYKKPLPVVPEYEQPAWDGPQQGKLMLQRCASCKATIYPFNSWCTACHSFET